MKAFLERLKKMLLHNWGLKFASILLAFVIWFIVAQVGDPKDTRAYSNIQVRLVNTNLLTEQNKYFAVIDGTDTVRVSVTAPTSVFQTLRASDIIAEADISKITDINTVQITYYATNTNPESISFEGDHDMVQLDVENKISKWLRVSYRAAGTVAEGYVIGQVTADQTSINITGPESVVNRVSSAIAELNVEGASNNSSANVEIILTDRENNVVDASKLEMSADHVLLAAEVLATKEVPVSVNYIGTPADGYVVVGSPEYDVKKVLLAGTPANLARVNRIKIETEKLDVTGATENVEVSLNIKDFLPDNIKLADSDFNGKVTVSIEVKATRERNLEVPVENVSFTNIPGGYVVSIPEEGKTPVVLKVFGLRDVVNTLRAANINGTADIAAYMRSSNMTELPAGHHHIPVTFDLGSEVTIVESGTILVEISKAE
ncbi:MAG: hypothetical protein J5546_05385 [Lachnospiraceae bacterium]|nr:hypothetical protein [Lachnospiraceae bacterium]